jgi:hypothetical protein
VIELIDNELPSFCPECGQVLGNDNLDDDPLAELLELDDQDVTYRGKQ